MIPKWLARTMLRFNNVEIVDHNNGDWPDQCVIPTAPHTSNRDFPYGIYSRPIMGQYINFVAKDSLFKWPLGPILRWAGGVPVIRSKRTNFVQAVADIFKTKNDFKLCIAVEGTRSKVTHFKTGFYFIALKADVPLVFCRFNFGERKVEFSKPYYLTGNIREDFDHIYRHFDGIKGLKPDNSFVYDPAVLDLLPEVRE
ncbi:1-acyl-sn-glycerol-3-phosphate acyltransferase [Neolewinella antarctica]|uniref:1-acyl-sn-glycerol-3-phosphate acyltransferase n=1 Tax=Neolewinella antarctica TaxID=442734 RepID=A0ABX0X9U0_9BACT|nr:1-acyl-sn-glycerol-3-phosphate acyltransferase [Neolewinella antarctica]NJC26033.1 1-acyl-sn-glycerol-3-phosphate acyltransferase [Neolewinella antarctica]